jgi:molybdopterin-guanine dinucleotide biosynthesis protein A
MAAIGFVAAGGLSRRMGGDKALLPWDRATLLDHALSVVRAVCNDTRVLCGPTPRYEGRGVRVHVDLVPDGGPLAGLHVALSQLRDDEVALLLAVDLPWVGTDLLRWLLERCTGVDAAVPVTSSGAEPLCAAYRASCLRPVARRLAAAERRMTCFWPDVSVRQLPESELARFGDPRIQFRNLNTPEEYEAERGKA